MIAPGRGEEKKKDGGKRVFNHPQQNNLPFPQATSVLNDRIRNSSLLYVIEGIDSIGGRADAIQVNLYVCTVQYLTAQRLLIL